MGLYSCARKLRSCLNFSGEAGRRPARVKKGPRVRQHPAGPAERHAPLPLQQSRGFGVSSKVIIGRRSGYATGGGDMPMTNDRRRLIEYVLIVTMLCGTAATASGQGASAEAGRTGRAEAGAPAAVVGAPGAAEAVGDPEAETDSEAGKPEEAEAAELEAGGRHRRARAAHRRARRGDRAAAQRRGRRAPGHRRGAAVGAGSLGRRRLCHRPRRVHRRVRRDAARELRRREPGREPHRQDDAVRLSAGHPLRPATGSATGFCSTPRSRSSTPRRSSSSSPTSTTRRPRAFGLRGGLLAGFRWGW